MYIWCILNELAIPRVNSDIQALLSPWEPLQNPGQTAAYGSSTRWSFTSSRGSGKSVFRSQAENPHVVHRPRAEKIHDDPRRDVMYHIFKKWCSHRRSGHADAVEI